MAEFESGGYIFEVTDRGVWMHVESVKSIAEPEFKQAYRAALNAQKQMTKRLKQQKSKAYVYIGLDTSDSVHTGGTYKIGSSYNAETRSGTGELQVVIECANRKAAYDIEFALHRLFASKRIHPRAELFRLTVEDVEFAKGLSADQIDIAWLTAIGKA